MLLLNFIAETSNQLVTTTVIAWIGAGTGIFGTVLSLILIWRSKSKLRISMLSANLTGGHHLICCEFLISNCSSLPIAVNRAAIKGKDDSLLYFSFQEKILLQTFNGKDIIREIRSSCPPIILTPYQSFKGIFTITRSDISKEAFPGLLDSKSNPAESWTIILETTRKSHHYKVTAPKANAFYTSFEKSRDTLV